MNDPDFASVQQTSEKCKEVQLGQMNKKYGLVYMVNKRKTEVQDSVNTMCSNVLYTI